MSDNVVPSVLVDHAGNVWAATYNGLAELDEATGTFKNYYAVDGLPSSKVSCVLEDDRHDLWLSTTRGISRFDPAAKAFTNYSVADGLPGMDFTGWVTCFKSPSGEMFFGGFSGATEFFPDKVVDESYVPPLVFTDFLLSGHAVGMGGGAPLKKSITYTHRLTLSHRQNTFSLKFAALGFSRSSLYRYRYRMDGLDGQWHEIAADQFVNYSDLATGEYTFVVQASMGRGVWNAPGAIMYIEVLPPWWKTWWFRALCAALCTALLWGAHQLRLRRLAQQFNVTLEARVSERTRIARELHDTLLQSFHGLLFRFQAVSDLLPQRPAEAKEKLDSTIDQAAEAITEGRDAVQDLRSSVVVTNDLAADISALGQALAADETNNGSGGFRMAVEGTPRALHPILRDEVYRIAGEALRNAFKHARARQIEVEIRFEERQLQLLVRDDGKGMNSKILEGEGLAGHFGLRGMRERAKIAGGRVDVWSKLGTGTEVEMSVPASIAYSKSDGRRKVFAFAKKTKD